MRMRTIALALAAAAAWGAGSAREQVEIQWSLMNDTVLLMEPIKSEVRIANYTGMTLDFSEGGNARLDFVVESDGERVRASGKPVLRYPVIIPDGDERSVNVDILQSYRVVRGMAYMVQPVVTTGGERFAGRRRSLEVQPGLVVFERTYGLKGAGQRTVTLRVLHRDRFDHVFFRLDQPETGLCLRTEDLGCIIRFVEPQVELDAGGVVHVLHQTAPERFSHAMFTRDGERAGQEYYAATAGSIRLVREEGAVRVEGGIAYEADPENPNTLTGPTLPGPKGLRTLGPVEPAE